MHGDILVTSTKFLSAALPVLVDAVCSGSSTNFLTDIVSLVDAILQHGNTNIQHMVVVAGVPRLMKFLTSVSSKKEEGEEATLRGLLLRLLRLLSSLSAAAVARNQAEKKASDTVVLKDKETEAFITYALAQFQSGSADSKAHFLETLYLVFNVLPVRDLRLP
jgi:hypothetical protein